MFNIDWDFQILQVLPGRRRLARFKALLRMLQTPVRVMYGWFITYKDDTLYRLAITGQIIYLEKLLNDKFNNGTAARGPSSITGLYDGNPTGIYIEDPADLIFPTYVWNKAEQRPKLWVYNKWNAAVHYQEGEFAVYGTKVWRALFSNVNKVPGSIPAKWVEHADRLWLHNKAEIDGEYDAIVYIPTAVGLVSNVNFLAQVKAEVEVYRIAGKRFNYVNY